MPILEALGSSLSVGQSLMDVGSGATFASTGTAPLLYLDPSKLGAASVLTLGGGAAFSLSGALFHDQNGGIGLSSDVVRVTGGASLIGSGASALVDLVGSSASTAGTLLSVSAGAVVDLVRASAPLLSLTQGAALTTDRTLVEISTTAAVKLSQMTALTASSLTIKGHGVSLSGGATMSVAGDLFPHRQRQHADLHQRRAPEPLRHLHPQRHGRPHQLHRHRQHVLDHQHPLRQWGLLDHRGPAGAVDRRRDRLQCHTQQSGIERGGGEQQRI